MADLDKSIGEIGISARTAGALARANVSSVRELVQRTDAELLKTDGISRERLKEIKGALAKLGLSLGTRLPEPADAAAPPPTPDVVLRFLAGDAATIDALARGDVSTWQAWLEHLVSTKPGTAAPSLIDRMLEREPSPARWIDLASRALFDIRSDVFFTSTSALRPFQAWFGDSVLAARGPTSRVSLEVRMDRELREAKGAAVCRALVADLRAARDAAGELLAQALLLLARRLAEEGDHLPAIEALVEAEALLDAPGDALARALGRRLRAASLLQLRRLEEAFAILDQEMSWGTPDPLLGSSRFSAAPEDEWDAALAEAATVAVWAASTTPEWVRALGGIAQHADAASKRGLWQRFERALVAMVDTSKNPGSDLEVVIRQAKQRRFDKTAQAASNLAKARGIELVANPHFG